ncbi:MAG: terminase small subunit [Sulfuricaulis sp.]|nr:terminase small subunit [Sulfuricaulis sp.]
MERRTVTGRSVSCPEEVVISAPPEDTPLTSRQAAFVAEYLIDLNGTQAAIRAGYSPPAAGAIATENLQKPAIAAAVARGKAQREARVNVKADSVLSEMSLLANSSIKHYVVDDEGQVQLAEGAPDGAMSAIKFIKRKTRVHYNSKGEVTSKDYDVELQLWDKPGSLKLMGRHVNLFPDRVEHTGPKGGPIEISEVRSVIVDPKAEGDGA